MSNKLHSKPVTLPTGIPGTTDSLNTDISGNHINKANLNMSHEKVKGVLLLLSASMGIGCLGIPSSIAQVGLIPWSVIICSVAGFYFISYYVIMKLCDHYEAYTVTQLGSRILNGNSFLIDLLYIVVNLAGYLACIITLNEDMPIISGLFPSNFIIDFLRQSDWIWIYISTIVTMLILVYIPVEKLHSITFISAVSSICLILFITFGFLYRKTPIDVDAAMKKNDWSMKFSIFMFLGFAFLCQQNLMTLRQASNIREFDDVMSTVKIFTGCILLIYTLIGIMGYFTFYDDPRLAHSNVLALYTNRDFFYALTMILVNLNIQVGNACMLYPIRDIIMEYVYGPKPIYINNQNRPNLSSSQHNKGNNDVSIFFRNNKHNSGSHSAVAHINNKRSNLEAEKTNIHSLNVTAGKENSFF
jgi:amino acid permease